MRKIIQILFVAVLPIVGIGLGYILKKDIPAKNDELSHRYIINTLQENSPWGYETAKQYLSVGFLGGRRAEDELRSMFKEYAKYGELRSIESINFENCFKSPKLNIGNNKKIDIELCNYLVKAKYQNALTNIDISLSLEGDELKVIMLSIKD